MYLSGALKLCLHDLSMFTFIMERKANVKNMNIHVYSLTGFGDVVLFAPDTGVHRSTMSSTRLGMSSFAHQGSRSRHAETENHFSPAPCQNRGLY